MRGVLSALVVTMVLSFSPLVPAAEPQVAVAAPESPAASDDANAALVKRTMNAFGAALTKRDLTEFLAAGAEPLRASTSAEAMKNFQSLADAGYEWSALRTLEPVLTRTLRQGDKQQVSGFYATQPQRVFFTFGYVREAGAWKLGQLSVRVRPLVTAKPMRHNAGWFITLDVVQPVDEIFYAYPETDFRSTGFTTAVDPETGNRIPSTQLSMATLPPYLIVKLVTPFGEQGPFKLTFDEKTELVRQDIEDLQRFPQNWLSFRDFDGRWLVYFTPLVSERCGVARVRYSIDSAALDREIKLPPCNLKNPGTIEPGMETFVSMTERPFFVNVQIDYADGSQSEVVRIDNR